jgi:GNAT superfamily N-acetyltransferase
LYDQNTIAIASGMALGVSICIITSLVSQMVMRRKIKFSIPERWVTNKYCTLKVKPHGECFFFQISNEDTKDKTLPYGWAFVEVLDADRKIAFLWNIFVREDIRRKGFGRDLMNILQENFNEIRTHTYPAIISRAGTQLCLACGFRMTQALIKRDPWLLVWQRGKGVSDKPRGNK